MRACQVCENPRSASLSTSQIEWHNLGHPGLSTMPPAPAKGLRSVVIIRPGDQILYEIKPGSWTRIEEADVAIAAGHTVEDLAANCRRCSRLVLDRRVRAPGLRSWLAARLDGWRLCD